MHYGPLASVVPAAAGGLALTGFDIAGMVVLFVGLLFGALSMMTMLRRRKGARP
jgi:hypothetical protein